MKVALDTKINVAELAKTPGGIESLKLYILNPQTIEDPEYRPMFLDIDLNQDVSLVMLTLMSLIFMRASVKVAELQAQEKADMEKEND